MALLDGKVAIVTGAGQGVGRGIALALAGEGARVVAAGRTYAKVEATVDIIKGRGGEGLAIRCDVGEEADILDSVKATIEAFGTIDILVNNAQEVPLGRLEEVSRDQFEAGLAIRAVGLVLLDGRVPSLPPGGGRDRQPGDRRILPSGPDGLR